MVCRTNDVPRPARRVLLAGIRDLNERVQNAEVRATEAGNTAGTYTIASWFERKGEVRRSATTTGAGDRRVCVRSTSLSHSKARTTCGENGLEFFAVGLDDFLVVRWQIYEHVKGHRYDSATILDLALTSLRFGAVLLRDISTELYHVLIMLTGRALRLVLKAAELEELVAC